MSSGNLPDINTQYGFNINANHGVYLHGRSYGYEKKVEVAAALITAQNEM